MPRTQRDGLRRIQKIVADLRDFAHLDESDDAETDLNEGVSATVSLLRSLMVFSMLLSLKYVSKLFYRHDYGWVGDVPPT